MVEAAPLCHADLPVKAWRLLVSHLGVRILIILVNSVLEGYELLDSAGDLGEARREVALLASVAVQVIVVVSQGLDCAILCSLHGFLVGVHVHQTLVAILIQCSLAKGLLEGVLASNGG